MAVIGVDITDATLRTRIVTAICGVHRYPATVPGPNPGDTPIPNPQSKPNFANDVVKKWLKDLVLEWETNEAGNAARKTASDKVAEEVVIP